MRSERYDALLDRLVLASQRPRLLLRVDDADDDELMRAAVRRPWERLNESVDALPPDPTDSALHDIRIRAKRARYAAEAVDPAFGKPARAFAPALVDVQDMLGEHQDAVVAGEWLRRAAAQSDHGHEGFAAGVLAAIEARAAQTSRAAWPACGSTPIASDCGAGCEQAQAQAGTDGETPPEPEVHAAGGLVRRTSPPRRAAAVRGRRRTSTSVRRLELPQGQARRDDADDAATALREVEEETGIQCGLGPGSARPGTGTPGSGQGRALLAHDPEAAETRDDFVPNREVDELGGARPGSRPTPHVRSRPGAPRELRE